MFTDPIADMLIRIKNGYQARKKLVEMPYSKLKAEIAGLLVKEGYLKKSVLKESPIKTFKTLELILKYDGKEPVLTGVKRLSKPGLRVYARATAIPRVRVGFGVTIVSTSKGLMTDKKARKKNLGGEVICQVW